MRLTIIELIVGNKTILNVLKLTSSRLDHAFSVKDFCKLCIKYLQIYFHPRMTWSKKIFVLLRVETQVWHHFFFQLELKLKNSPWGKISRVKVLLVDTKEFFKDIVFSHWSFLTIAAIWCKLSFKKKFLDLVHVCIRILSLIYRCIYISNYTYICIHYIYIYFSEIADRIFALEGLTGLLKLLSISFTKINWF